MPKEIFDNFTKIGFDKNMHHWPLFVLRVKDKFGRQYFNNYDFGFEMFTGPPSIFSKLYEAIQIESGKTDKHFSLPNQYLKELSIYDRMRLEVRVIETLTPAHDFYNKAIVYKKLMS